MGLQVPVRSRTIQQLQALTTPAQGQLEAVNWKYYDTQPITTAVTTVLNFFATVQTDKTLGNIEQPGQIQAPNWFEVYAIKCDFLELTTSTAAPGILGAVQDIAAILYTQRAMYELTVNSKSYGKTPLTFAHSSGGPVGLVQGTPAAAAVLQFANNSIPDEGDWLGGWVLDPATMQQQQVGSIILQPTQAFSLSVTMAAAPTLTTTPLNCRMSICGVLHRQVR